MRTPLVFAAGFVAGWVTRGTVDPAKSATVQIVAFGLDVVARVKRALAIERERFEDLVAEARDEVSRRTPAGRRRRGGRPRSGGVRRSDLAA